MIVFRGYLWYFDIYGIEQIPRNYSINFIYDDGGPNHENCCCYRQHRLPL